MSLFYGTKGMAGPWHLFKFYQYRQSRHVVKIGDIRQMCARRLNYGPHPALYMADVPVIKMLYSLRSGVTACTSADLLIYRHALRLPVSNAIRSPRCNVPPFHPRVRPNRSADLHRFPAKQLASLGLG